MIRTLCLGSALFLITACRDATLPVTDPAPLFDRDGAIMATTEAKAAGMVSAANPIAVEVGLATLAKGGSAVDAAVTVQAALGLVEPQSSGLGGGAFMMVYDPKTGDVWNYDGRETAPSNVDETLFLSDDGEPVRYGEAIASGQSTGAPGAMAMLGMAQSDYGKLPWDTLFEPVIPIAEDGFEVSPRMASLVERMSNFVLGDEANAKAYYFLEDGETPIPEGFLRRNPDYADTLYALAKNPRAILEGPIAEAIVTKISEEPRAGTLSLADLRAYQPVKRRALCGAYRGLTVCGARPPASGGFAVLSALGMLEDFDMETLGQTSQGWHIFIEASRLAYADRDAYLSAAETMDVSLDQLLSPDYLESRANLIKSDSAMTQALPGDFNPATDATPDNPGTSHFTIVDEDGLTVSMTTTVEAPFGSQRMVGGFMLNNQLTDFSFRSVDAQGRAIPNRVGPGKRPRSSMSPTIVFDEAGEFLFTTGSPGGNSIIAYTLKSIVGVVDWGLTPQEAANLPNIIARGDRVRVEESAVSPELVSTLESLGHEIALSKGEISGIHMIYRHLDGHLEGAADTRREGIVGEASPVY